MGPAGSIAGQLLWQPRGIAQEDSPGELQPLIFFKGEELAATVAHEMSVVNLMDTGMSRVDAEAEVFKGEDTENPKGQVDPEEYCTSASQPEFNRNLSAQQRVEDYEKGYLAHSECVQSRKRAANQGRDYLRCVQSYKDSKRHRRETADSPTDLLDWLSGWRAAGTLEVFKAEANLVIVSPKIAVIGKPRTDCSRTMS